MTQKQWMYVGVISVVLILIWFFLRKKKAESNFTRIGVSRGVSTGLTAKTNPLKDCIKICQAKGFPYEKCLSDCSNSGPTTSTQAVTL